MVGRDPLGSGAILMGGLDEARINLQPDCSSGVNIATEPPLKESEAQ